MAFAAGALTQTVAGQSFLTATSAVATGGTGPYTYQWYRSTTTGFTPGAGSLISGATALTLNDSGLLAGTQYYYKVRATDTGNGNVTTDSAQLAVLTEPSQNQNQFAMQQQPGLVDMRVGPTNIISAQVAASVANNTVPYNVVNQGQGVKIVANTTGGIPQIQPIQAKSDIVFGFVVYNVKDTQYVAGQNLEIARGATTIWLYATGAITQAAQVCLDPTFVGGVQATGNSATIVGQAIDGAAAAGLIRVELSFNPAGTTA
jgi:hypothetical protein